MALDCLSFDVSSGTNKPIKLQRDKWRGGAVGDQGEEVEDRKEEGEKAGGERRWCLQVHLDEI